MREFQVLGITLTDHSVKEAMKKVETYIRNGQVSTLCYITASGLLEAEDHPETKEFLENMSLTIAADPEVLKVAGITSKSRIRKFVRMNLCDSSWAGSTGKPFRFAFCPIQRKA